MAVVTFMQWDDVTPQQYDEVSASVGRVTSAPTGGRVHLAAFDSRGLRITEAWDTVDDFERFVDTQLLPAVTKLGIAVEPVIEVLPLHELSAPDPAKEVAAP